jgi:hypothetical protein
MVVCVGGGLTRSFRMRWWHGVGKASCGHGGGGGEDEGAFEGVRDWCAGPFPSLVHNPTLQGGNENTYILQKSSVH